MLADVFCHNFLSKSLSWMHTKTRKSITRHVGSLLGGRATLSLSSIGRHLSGKAQVKHKINMCWRFLSNKKIHNIQGAIYKIIFTSVLTPLNELLIAVDWTGCCSAYTHMLRASLVHAAIAILIRYLYSKRMQIEQNFRDDKSERFGSVGDLAERKTQTK